MMKLIQRTFHKSGASIKSLSERSGVPYASCYGVVKESRDPALSTAAKLCKVLGLQLVSVERKA
ncbi:MAG: helix-turn-helix transcriptional regulator [Planctomycetota bacterium]